MLNITHVYLSYSQYCTRISGVLAHGGLGLVSGKKVLSGALLDRFKSQQRLKFLRISSAIMSELTGTKIFNGL